MNTEQSNERPMSAEQRRMIFALYRELGIGEELRHDVQHGVAGKTSLTDFTSHDAARLIEHLQYRHFTGIIPAAPQSLTSPPQKAGASSVTVGSAPAPKSNPTSILPFPRGGAGGVKNVHKLPSPEQLAVLERLYAFAGYATLEAQRAFADRIEKHPRPRSMWEAEELIFALVAQAAPKMLAAITAPDLGRLTPFENAFMFTNRVKFYPDGTLDQRTFNAAKIELETYVGKKNKRGKRTMPRFSLTKFFEIVGKYK